MIFELLVPETRTFHLFEELFLIKLNIHKISEKIAFLFLYYEVFFEEEYIIPNFKHI